MINQIHSIADRIKAKLQSEPTTVNKIVQYVKLSQESKSEDISVCMQFLLSTACKCNLLQEIHDLLALNIVTDINQTMHFEEKDASYSKSFGNGATLLGLAAFHGHIEIVSYLVEVRLANVNAKDVKGNTPLHQVVYGDSYPFNNAGYGISHDKVAKYLIRKGGDLSVKNSKLLTPHDCTKWCAPLKIEEMVGRRFITNTGSATYYADKVRPILEKEIARKKHNQNISLFNIAHGERQAKDFDMFCLEHAIEAYVKNKKSAFGYSSIDELYLALDSLSAEEWKHIRIVVSSQEPVPFSFKLGIINNQLTQMGKQSAAIGTLVAILTFYETKSILLAVTTGSISAMLAWNYLTEARYKQKINERALQEQRVSELQQHDRFFKAPSQSDEIQHVAGNMELQQ